jgi:hypothetical protein
MRRRIHACHMRRRIHACHLGARRVCVLVDVLGKFQDGLRKGREGGAVEG